MDNVITTALSWRNDGREGGVVVWGGIRPNGAGALPNRTPEGNVLFNDALNTFYLRLYGVGPVYGGRMKPIYYSDNVFQKHVTPIIFKSALACAHISKKKRSSTQHSV